MKKRAPSPARPDEDSRPHIRFATYRDLARPVLLGYSQIFFAKNLASGFLFMAATFVVPSQGMAGLAGLLLSNFWARVFSFPEEHIKEGYFAYNGILTGLALGLTYEVNTAFVVLMALATAMGTMIASTLRSLFERYLFVPVLSLPFVITTWIAVTGGRGFSALRYTLEPYQLGWLSTVFPREADLVIRSLGAALFQLSVPAGILVCAGVIIYSRHALVLSVLGILSGAMVYGILMGNIAELTTGLTGFNFALTAMAVGGVWIVPGIDSFLLAMGGGAVCAVVSAASAGLLKPLGLPPLAFPFVFTTSTLLYALKHRIASPRFRSIAIPEDTPEKNLKRHKNVTARFVTGEIPAFEPPFSGEWCITQGFSGEHTHKGLWSHAWDFEIMDYQGRNYRGKGVAVEEFHCYNTPVLAPADGKVVTVINHIEDNPVGKVNVEHNWGNLVILWHYGSVYTALCHFRTGSIAVKEGEVVRRGQFLGRVGNSGRSSVPHLHFQAQLSPAIGSPTTPAELMHFTSSENGGSVYLTHGCPARGDRIRPLETDSTVFDTVSLTLGRTWTYQVRFLNSEWMESWEVEIDFTGNRYLLCRQKRARLRFWADSRVLLFLEYHGPRTTGLQFFFMGVPRIPMTRGSVRWNDELPGDLLLPPLSCLLFDLAEPFFQPARLRSSSRLVDGGEGISVKTELAHDGPLADRSLGRWEIISTFERPVGLAAIKAENGRGGIVSVELKDMKTG